MQKCALEKPKKSLLKVAELQLP